MKLRWRQDEMFLAGLMFYSYMTATLRRYAGWITEYVARLIIARTLPVAAICIVAFSSAAVAQEKIAPLSATDSFYSKAVQQADPRHNPLPPDTLLRCFPLPAVSQLRECQPANTYLLYYLVGRLGELSQAYRKDSITGKALIAAALGYLFDSVMRWGASYGDDYILTLLAPKWCTPPVVEYFLAARIRHCCDEQYYENALQIWKNYQRLFPNGEYADSCRRALGILERRIAANSQNPRINFHETTESPSLAALVAPYKGKIVYLDIWGTWCGPCREEMRAVPALQQYFEGKDIVFLYLDTDAPEADDKWRNFVRLKGITGEHCRLSSDQMEQIWQSLLPGKKAHFYPSYFIFDRAGNLIVTNARRPSDKEILYAQLDRALKRP